MKRLISLLLVTLLFSGCGFPTPVSEDLSTSHVRRVADTTALSIYVVTVEGRDYIVVNATHGVSICPKTP